MYLCIFYETLYKLSMIILKAKKRRKYKDYRIRFDIFE